MKKKKKSSSKELVNITNFLFEAGSLSHTPRSFYNLLGGGSQSVAEHITRTVIVGYTLGRMHGKADDLKIIKMCLFHDLAEARTSDLNYVNQKYAQAEEARALDDLAQPLPFGDDILSIVSEYKARVSTEALLAKDADNIEFILSLRETQDVGNSRAGTWIPSAVKRLKTKEAKKLVRAILKTPSDKWWFADKNDEWWVNRKRK